MREYKIYYDDTGKDTLAFRKFAKEIENRINSNDEILAAAKKVNIEFSEKVKEILSDGENAIYAGSMINGLITKTPKYRYIKNVSFNGTCYDVEINLLNREFTFCEI